MKPDILKLAVQSLRRDWRSGEIRLIAIAIVIAVASLTSVGFFTDRVKRASESQATELLAADLVIQSRQPVADEVREMIRSAGLVETDITSMRSMVMAGENLQMAEVKAVEAGYPLRGKLRTSSGLFTPETVTSDIPESGTVWIDSRLFQLLGIQMGDSVRVGSSSLTVSRIITYEPDRGGDMFNIAPRMLMNLADLPATGLVLPASRIDYSLLLGGNPEAIEQFRVAVEGRKGLRLQGIRDARPELKSALERAEQFLGLAALVSVALAGLAVAMSAQRYVVRHFDNCAIMRCLGADQRTITSVYLLQLLILSLLGSLAGAVLGYLGQQVLGSMLAGMTTSELPAASVAPLFTGIAAGTITAIGFAMPQILRLRHVSPLRVLRRDMDPLPPGAVGSYGTAVLALALLSPWQSGNPGLTLWTFLGIIVTAFLLTIGAIILIRFLDRFRNRVGTAFRFGLANINRRAGSSIAQIIGIGLGVMVMLLLTLVRTDLLNEWRGRLPEGTPNYFLINISAEDVPELNRFLQDQGKTTAAVYPMTGARLARINNVTVDPEAFPTEAGQRWARRAYNLTWSEALPAANEITGGVWWEESTTDEPLFSFEEGIATDLGVGLGDSITFLIAGAEVTGRITSIRKVQWDTFNVNFFVIANPGTLDNYPASFITSFYLPPEDKDLIIELVRAFPSVTVYDVDALISEVRRIMEQVVRTIEFVFGFTLLSGIVVLAAALQTTHDERTYESALLSAIGAGRRQILAGLAAEFICIGMIAGILAAWSATVVEVILAKYVFKMDIVINYMVWVIAPLTCTVVIAAAGLAGTWRVLSTPPVVALRQN